MKQNNPYRILMSGGGTGGHIFPAVAIAREIQRVVPEAVILFVGALGKMEMEKVPRAGFRIVGLPVSAFHRRLTARNLLFPFRLVISLIKAAKVVKDFHPDLVIGTGGFASGPVLRIATRKGIPVIIQEQNSFPGITNRLVAKKADHICVAYPGMEKYFPAGKMVLTGNPVRSDLLLPPEKRASSRISFGVAGSLPVILVFGGSLGARTLNRSLAAHITQLALEPVGIIWQTGSAFAAEASRLVGDAGARNIQVHEFIYNMDEAYSASDLVVCRSGAITLSELALVGKPAILVPFPAAAEDHQTKNATVFADAGAAIVVPDREAGNVLVDTMLRLVRDTRTLAAMSEKISGLAKPDATQLITKLALTLLNRQSLI